MSRKRFFINLVQPRSFSVWNQKLQQMHGGENAAFDQDVIWLPAIKAAHSSALSACTAPSASQLLIISNRLIAHHLYLSSVRLHSDNNCMYLQVQKQSGAIHGCRCCQPYQLCSSVREMAKRCNPKGWWSATISTQIKAKVLGSFHTCWQCNGSVRGWQSDEDWKDERREALSELLSIDFLRRLWTAFFLWLSD